MIHSENLPHHDEETETALLEAELFLKYQVPHRALERLRLALERKPHSVRLRERLREIALATKRQDEAARQCLALANLYISNDDFDQAQERLLEAKQLDARISITSGLEAIRRARREAREQRHARSLGENTDGAPLASQAATPPAAPSATPPLPNPLPPPSALAGDLSAISIFDAVQVIENSRLTGNLAVMPRPATADARAQRIHFNDGRIVGAEAGDATGQDGFRRIIEITEGSFTFERAATHYPITINAMSNTNLLLDSLRQLDEEKQ